MSHTHSRRILVWTFAALFSSGVAVAQLKLPRQPKEKTPTSEPKGDLAPHLDCLVCGTRTYTAHVDGRKDAGGNDLVWCETCKRDTAHKASINTEPGLGGGSTNAGGGVQLPRRGGEPAAPAPPTNSAPTVPTQPAASTTDGARAVTTFVFGELKHAKGVEDPMLASAVESLVAAGEPGFNAARTELASQDPLRLLVAARTLLRGGKDSDLDLLRARIATKLPANIAPGLIAQVAARDPVRAGPAWIASLLEHPQGVVRQAAQRDLARLDGAEILPFIEKYASDKRVDTRLAAIELAAGVVDVRTTEILLTHLDDASSRVAATAVRALALREEPGLDARLLGIAFKDKWLLRRGAYAVVAIVEREDMKLAPILDSTHVEALLTALDAKDAFVSATAATALAGIGFQSTEPKTSEWLDKPVVERLVLAVSGREFHDDLSSIVPGALRRLRTISGQSFATDGPRWIDWWVDARTKFEARRAALEIHPSEIAGTLVRFEATTSEPEAFTLVGPELLSSAETRVTAGEIFYLNQAEITDLVLVLTREGLLGPEILPGPRGSRGRGDRTLEIQAGARAKSFTLGASVKETWFERATEACRALRDRNRWQRFPAVQRGRDALAMWREESAWWGAEHTESERDDRLRGLVLTSMKNASPTQRALSIAELERIYAKPDGASPNDFEALLALLGEESIQGDRASRLAKLALASARELGNDGFVPDAMALALAGAYTKLFGTNAVDALAEQFQSARREFVRAIALDERPILRAVAAKTLAVNPSPDDLAVLIRLLDDADLSVETAAVTALGEHKVEAARTELLVRARVAFPPVRAAALSAIGRMGGEYVLEALIQGINDKERVVRVAAAQGLAALADPAAAQVLISALVEVGDTEVFDAARAGIMSMGEGAWPDLIRVVNQPTGRIRREAALILAEQCHPDAVSPLLSILTSNTKDARVASELAILTCVDLRGQPEPARAWWSWWDGVRHDDASAWFRAALERLGVAPPPPGALEGGGSVQGRLFLVAMMDRPEPWLAERARREYRRLIGRDPGERPAMGTERDAWLRSLRESASKG
ncbi:MAG: HEAT repeat domain-containing protein [Planctomycetota bacterium]|nr:HEAT repeat domain-containing protein [Planctomycetota bacterium]